jgi:peroxiredoxin
MFSVPHLRTLFLVAAIAASTACRPTAPAPAEGSAALPATVEAPAATQAGSGAATTPTTQPADTAPRTRELTPTPDAEVGTLPEGVGLPVGTAVPAVSVATLNGTQLALTEYFANGPTMVVFYRGGWCPYCNFQLRELTQQYGEFTRRNLQLVAISVDTVDAASQTNAAFEIPFPVLSDPDLLAHNAFAVSFPLDNAEVERLTGFGIDLEAASGRDHHTIAVPSIFIVDRGGVVRWGHANREYRQRPSTAQLLAAYDALQLPAAADTAGAAE